MIAANGLSCGYGDRTVLRDISFSHEGDLCILGRNGVGKSTLLRALCGLIPYRGSLTLEGREVRSYSPRERARMLTYIPPKLTVFDPYITAGEFVLMGRHPYRGLFESDPPEEVDAARRRLDAAGIDPRRSVSQLSSGQQQMLLIAQALTQRSPLLCFDEPTANLDPYHLRRFHDTLLGLDASLRRFVVTHDLDFARALGFPVLFLEADRAERFTPGAFFTSRTLSRLYGVAFAERNCTGVDYG